MFIRKNPFRFSIYQILGILLTCLLAYLSQSLFESPLGLFCMIVGLFVIFVKSILIAFLDGIEINGDEISAVTDFGGIESIRISEIDLERSYYDKGTLLLIERSGNKLTMSSAEYTESNIAIVASVANVSPS